MLSSFDQALVNARVFAWFTCRPVWLRLPLWLGCVVLLGPALILGVLGLWLYATWHAIRLGPKLLDGELALPAK